jgi:hypothetical protein
MSNGKDTVSVLAGHLAEAVYTVFPQSRNAARTDRSRVTLWPAPKRLLVVDRLSSQAVAPIRSIRGAWFDSVSVDGHILSLVSRLFEPMQTVQLTVERHELVVNGPSFRLCIKRLPNETGASTNKVVTTGLRASLASSAPPQPPPDAHSSEQH